MTTIGQFINSSPVNAMELFAKLLETSDTAIKTRERVFADLKEELEFVIQREEQHLFPVLKKHKETKELVRDALADNRQTRKLLTELEHTSKDDESFISKMAELRRSFQQHVRDERKELLPAVMKALSDEEAEMVLAGIEEEKAEIEAAKRAEAEQRRAEARQEREQVETVQRTAEGMASTVRSVVEGAQRASRTSQDAVHTGLGTASEVAQRSTAHVVELFSLSGRQAQDVGAQAAENVQAVAHSSAAFVRGFQEVGRAWFEMTQSRFEKNAEAFTALARCRTVPEFVAAQTSLVRGNVELAVEHSQRLAELSVSVAEEVTRNVAGQRGSSRKRASRAA